MFFPLIYTTVAPSSGPWHTGPTWRERCHPAPQECGLQEEEGQAPNQRGQTEGRGEELEGSGTAAQAPQSPELSRGRDPAAGRCTAGCIRGRQGSLHLHKPLKRLVSGTGEGDLVYNDFSYTQSS